MCLPPSARYFWISMLICWTYCNFKYSLLPSHPGSRTCQIHFVNLNSFNFARDVKYTYEWANYVENFISFFCRNKNVELCLDVLFLSSKSTSAHVEQWESAPYHLYQTNVDCRFPLNGVCYRGYVLKKRHFLKPNVFPQPWKSKRRSCV